mmetsp:Transcript_26249/g.48847  ORF Transcript_26249/g.48847 Transcript_26249/m.48847 type:complete len:230 (-) Transcript_26249:320-1009(-)|eukprot:CAMPEP_0197441082 /NCGR_PEP_ID=MMETSP1175-20131217/7438_1 /TAXON_ID=1003142 /ORGANISM="Triceratium dubium, Strain CCMP147" /LENGTH=229 /DNA_ID=CAMNT_0042971309 /DNA_START=314 /DNA_END=1003 /DNA_ORIENTATION=-
MAQTTPYIFRLCAAPATSTSRAIAILVLLFHSVAVIEVFGASDRINQTAYYQWSDLNHYEILNLHANVSTAEGGGRQKHLPLEKRRSEREAVQRGEVKRAYYTQARKHHPDRAVAPDTDGVRPAKSQVKESTARMARIAGAYETLSDDRKKKKYDGRLLRDELSEETKDKYAADLGKKRCRRDSDCDTGNGECCIKFHFEFCGVLSSFPAKGLKCVGKGPIGPVQSGTA